MVVKVRIPREPFEPPISDTSSAIPSSHCIPETPKEMGIVTIHEDVTTALATAKAVSLQMRPLSDVPNTIVEGASSASEAASTLVDIWTPVFQKIDIFCRLMDTVTEVHPYAKTAWIMVSAVQKIIKTQMDRDEKIKNLLKAMDSFYDIVDDLKSGEKIEKIESSKDVLQRIAQQTTECCFFIRDYAKPHSFWKRTGHNLFSNVDDKIDGYCTVLRELKEEFYGRVTVQTKIVVTQILDEVQASAMQFGLDDIPYAAGAGFQMSKGCQSGTRTSILDEIAEWITRDDGSRVFLLLGAAGTGKSAIAHTVAGRSKASNRLGSSFSFVRGQADRGPEKLVSTVARDLSDFSESIRHALGEVVQYNKGLRTTLDIAMQFENLILKPVEKLTLTGPLVIVIDALDECSDPTSREALLLLLANRTQELPPNFRILLTSRLEKDIETTFSSNDKIIVKKMDDIPSQSTRDDIRLYINNKLGDLDRDDIDAGCKSTLVDQSEGLFQWASVACEFIKGVGVPGSTPRERYDLLIQGTTSETWHLDGLYMTVLSHFFQNQGSFTEKVMDRFRLVMALLLSAFEPLSMKSLDMILYAAKDRKTRFDPKIILEYMGSLLSGVTGKEPIRPLHTSFRDFLLDSSRSRKFHVDTTEAHKDLTLASLSIMNSELSFNICHLESSYTLNEAIGDLANRIQEHIPEHLSYSCRFWASHLQRIPSDDLDVRRAVALLLSEKLLFWIEVASLLGAVHGAVQALSSLMQWCTDANDDARELLKHARDAHAFINTFGVPISQSTPHIYLSALPFCPPTSIIHNCFSSMFHGTLRVCKGAATGWPTVQHIIYCQSQVSSVAFSRDGTRIVSGSHDKTIRMWDSSTGKAVGEPLEGHTDRVWSVALSRDGTRIVSGSSDKTIRMWDSSTGKVVGEPLEGHTDRVWSVAFSRDGTRIVSGSSDKTIRMWDSSTGKAVGEPLEGHTGPVGSVAFSRDGTRIVSGSSDKTIRMWDSSTGKAVGEPLEGHTDWVRSVAFSRDGTRIVSGSSDSTIRMWDSSTGKALGEPLEGHTGLVWSVAFSRDGTRIVSGSRDSTIRMWDSSTGKVVGEPLEGHTGLVWSVAFSRDGTRIVSGSSDMTIRMWDSSTGKAVGEPLEGHTGPVNSVAFSRDGTRIVSGSDDKTIRMWDSSTGKAVGEPLEGHTGPVWSVAFSRDGTRIVSGSRDSTIRMWDSSTGKAVGEPLEGHTGLFWSVAFSRDGTRIVSGSRDSTIRMWDSSTGKAVGEPLEGHTDWVRSVAFSRDGTRIVSGSFDKTIRMWDSSTGKAVGEPLEGHTGPVWSVAFSRDGTRIVSGSSDSTIRMWDSSPKKLVGELPQGNPYQVEFPLLSELEHACSPATMCDPQIVTSAAPSYLPPITFSSQAEHALRHVDDIFPSAPADGSRASITLRDDGWVVGLSDKLLFWLPFDLRAKIRLPRMLLRCGVDMTELDLSRFIHGPSWSECYRVSADDDYNDFRTLVKFGCIRWHPLSS
ncbi:hypothetical protein HETIRDRAFT_441691 [Heterobasidion irregulare TC 32-1]|uniref:AAA+ ATPase domain-containing protein n=1 Tax=Heterobasidion irregulare (strain TC 32-1) TaxID=747525 RepID=W4JU76_HETIT|nr:uncharacterized protein HETIRDRAFT_441691 [Heterobasidion irregulare TC 32-1]ETW77107.1 hypothetical protein HETIRDRAFT_441691 [Heterobasidion irregulare TC 32-1]